jgi:ankyrin repeat protein
MESRTHYTIAGHKFNISLKDQLSNAAGLAIWAKDWIGDAVKASPEASVAWAGVCLMLPFLTNAKIADEANRNGFVYVTTRMKYYAGLEPLLSRLCEHQDVPDRLREAAQDAIVTLYQHVLDFQIRSVLRFYRNGFLNYVRDVTGHDGWKTNLEAIERLETSVRQDLTQMNRLVARQALDDLNTSANKSLEALGQFLALAHEHLQVAKAQREISQKLLQVEQDRDKQKLTKEEEECLQLFLLAAKDKDTTYEWYKSRIIARIENTCGWFLDHEHFRKWLGQASGPLLVSADPGCGKSVLAKYLVDHELPRHGATTICYFFFKDQDQNTVRQALCALLHQLLAQQPHLIRHAMTERQKMGENLVNSTESLWRIWQSSTEDDKCVSVTVVLDALDECLQDEFRNLIQKLQLQFQRGMEGHGRVKYLLTSRPYDEITSEFRELEEAYPYIRIPGEDESEVIGREIDHVVRYRVQRLAKEKGLSPAIASHLEKRLLGIQHRTYLWTYIVFDHLKLSGFKKTPRGIDTTIIDTLPENVSQAYEKILSKCQDDPVVRRILCIILAAREPLTVREMNIAANLTPEARSIGDVDLEDPADFKSRLRRWCGLFVSVHHDKVYFLHQTAREFLLKNVGKTQPVTAATQEPASQWRHSISMVAAHGVIADACIIYYSIADFDSKFDGFLADFYSKFDGFLAGFDSYSSWNLFSCYAAGNLCFHFEEAHASQSDISDIAQRMLWLCDYRCPKFRTWLDNYLSFRERDLSFLYTDSNPTTLMIASLLSLKNLVRCLLESGHVDVQARDQKGRTALFYAAGACSIAIMELLLEKGLDIEAKDEEGFTALSYVTTRVAEATNAVKLLLERGADPDTRLSHRAYSYPGERLLLHYAKWGPHNMIPVLIDKGANIHATDHRGRTTLSVLASCYTEYDGWDSEVTLSTMALLLRKGADIETRDDMGRTPLSHASYSRHKKTGYITHFMWVGAVIAFERATRLLLLENGDNINARDKQGRSALTHAILGGTSDTVKNLLDRGALIAPVDIEKLHSAMEDAVRHNKTWGMKFYGELEYMVDCFIEKLNDGKHREWVKLLSDIRTAMNHKLSWLRRTGSDTLRRRKRRKRRKRRPGVSRVWQYKLKFQGLRLVSRV